MNLDFDSLSDAEILGVLQRAQVVPKRGNFQLQRFPVSGSRKDVRRRVSLRVWHGDQPLMHLMVGRGLAPLHRRAGTFYRHNPELGVRPLFFIKQGGIDYFGQEFAGLHNLDEARAARRLDDDGWKNCLQHVANRLRATGERSTPAQLMREMAEFEAAVLGLASLARVDAVFLRDTVFPYLRLEAGRVPPTLTWSNGDFIARNIVLDGDLRPRLIDYEFARRTHFAALDWFRLEHFSTVPEGVRLADLGAPLPLPPWLEIQGWLDHAIKLDATCAPEIALSDLRKISERIARLVEASGAERPRPVFFDFVGAAGTRDDHTLVEAGDTLAVEWARHGATEFRAEPPIVLQPSNWTEIHVDLSGTPGRAPQLRLRLPSTPCVLELRGLEVYGRARDQVLWTVDSAQIQTVVSCSGALLELATSEGLGIVQFGGESHVTLPPIPLNRSVTAAGLSFWVRYVPDLQDFSRRLRHAFADGDLPALLPGEPTAGRLEAGQPAPITAQLFHPEDGTYAESRSRRQTLPETNAWTSVEFAVPPLPAGAILRLDPADQPGILDLSALTLQPADAGPDARVTDGLAGLQCENHALLLEHEDGLRLLMFGGDPILKLAPLGAALANRALRLTLVCRYQRQAAHLWAGALLRQREELLGLHVHLDESRRQAQDLEAKVRAESHRGSAAETALTETRESLARQQLTLAGRESELAGTREELARAQQQLTQARAELEQARAEALRQTESAQQERAAVERAAQRTAETESQLAELRAELLRQTESAQQAHAATERATHRIGELETQLATVVANEASVRQALADLTADRTRVGAELEAARGRSDELANNLTLAGRQIEDLRGQLARAERAGAETGALLEDSRQALDRLQAQHAALQECLLAQNDHILGLEQNGRLLDGERTELAASLEAARTRVRELLAMVESLKDRPLLQLDRGAARLIRATLAADARGDTAR